MQINPYVNIPSDDADVLERALATKGPVVVNLSNGPWRFDGGGVFIGCSKPGGSVFADDVALVVGYSKNYCIFRKSLVPKGARRGTSAYPGRRIIRNLWMTAMKKRVVIPIQRM